MAVALVAVPLTTASRPLYLRSKALRIITKLAATNPHWLACSPTHVDLNLQTSPAQLQIEVSGPKDAIDSRDIVLMEQELSKSLDLPVRVMVYFTEYRRIDSTSQSKTVPAAQPDP